MEHARAKGMERIHEVHGRDGHGSGSQVRGIENEERPCHRNAFGVSGNSADDLGDVMRVRGDVIVSCREGTTVSMVARKVAQGNGKG